MRGQSRPVAALGVLQGRLGSALLPEVAVPVDAGALLEQMSTYGRLRLARSRWCAPLDDLAVASALSEVPWRASALRRDRSREVSSIEQALAWSGQGSGRSLCVYVDRAQGVRWLLTRRHCEAVGVFVTLDDSEYHRRRPEAALGAGTIRRARLRDEVATLADAALADADALCKAWREVAYPLAGRHGLPGAEEASRMARWAFGNADSDVSEVVGVARAVRYALVGAGDEEVTEMETRYRQTVALRGGAGVVDDPLCALLALRGSSSV